MKDVCVTGDRLVAQPEQGFAQGDAPTIGTNERVIGLHGGQNTQEYVDLLENFQSQVLAKLAMCERPGPEVDVQKYLHAVVPLGFQPYDQAQTRNVALVISQALDYENVRGAFPEDIDDIKVAQRSLLLLEMLILMFEHWVSGFEEAPDQYLFGIMISVLEVLIHSPPFWARLKQSRALSQMLLKIQDGENSNTMLKKKTVAILKAIAADQFSKIPDPVDAMRFRQKEGAKDLGQFQDLPQQSSLVPVYEDHQQQEQTFLQNHLQLAEVQQRKPPQSVPTKMPSSPNMAPLQSEDQFSHRDTAAPFINHSFLHSL